jgi:uncharacterized membrane protein
LKIKIKVIQPYAGEDLTGGRKKPEEPESAMTKERFILFARIIFGLSVLFFGSLHFIQPEEFDEIVPRWMAWERFWVYFAGTALCLAGISLTAGIYMRLSGILLSLLFFTFIALVRIPQLTEKNSEAKHSTLVELPKDLAFAGASLLIAFLENKRPGKNRRN